MQDDKCCMLVLTLQKAVSNPIAVLKTRPLSSVVERGIPNPKVKRSIRLGVKQALSCWWDYPSLIILSTDSFLVNSLFCRCNIYITFTSPTLYTCASDSNQSSNPPQVKPAKPAHLSCPFRCQILALRGNKRCRTSRI